MVSVHRWRVAGRGHRAALNTSTESHRNNKVQLVFPAKRAARLREPTVNFRKVSVAVDWMTQARRKTGRAEQAGRRAGEDADELGRT